MKIEEIARALQEYAARDRVPLSRLPDILETWGYLEGEDDRRGKCRAIAAMMRQVLKDKDVAALLQKTFDFHAVRSFEGLFDIDTGKILPEQSWKESSARRRAVEAEVKRLREATVWHVRLLQFLAGKLAELKCEEDIDLPRLREDLFPPVEYPRIPTPSS